MVVQLVFNEQYMCSTQTSETDAHPAQSEHPALTNRIVKVLSHYGPTYRTFGENLILLLNRESALGPQLLILKVLYLLFTTPPTFEYFYTNDLHVLVDVIMRNLLDLDPGFDDDPGHEADREGGGQKALRHTYLRVLCPLLRNTQLSRDGYKREDLRKLFYLLVNRNSLHFAPVDETVVRLVSRCRQVDWIRDESDEPLEELEKRVVGKLPSERDVAQKVLGMNLSEAGESNLSVLSVAAKVEKRAPIVPPRRRRKKLTGDSQASAGNGSLKVPPTDAYHVSEAGDRSPFSDDEWNE